MGVIVCPLKVKGATMSLDLYTRNIPLTQKAKFWGNYVSALKGNADLCAAPEARVLNFYPSITQTIPPTFPDLRNEFGKLENLMWKQVKNKSAPTPVLPAANDRILLSPPSGNTSYSSADLPDSVNWVEAGAVTDIKNQGKCGSCWAFSLTAQVESYNQITNDELLELSTQQVTSCTPNLVQCGGTGGCYGSVTQLGFNYLQLFGSVTEEDWPYVSGTTSQTEDCEYDLQSKTPAIGITGFDTLPANDEQAVMKHLAEVGPLAIAVDASVWHSYSGGVFDGCSFDENISINHGVQLVGYGSDFSPMGVYDYWLVRNSWGSSWGEEGYIKLLRTSECGVNSTPMDGTACVNGPGTDMQTVCGMCGMLLDPSY